MLFTSTRDNTQKVTSAQAIARGIAGDGGLYVPVEIPRLDPDMLDTLKDASYEKRAEYILGLFLSDYTADELEACISGAYTGKFGEDGVAPLAALPGERYVLELWHGPTCAFKDVALQLLPHLLTRAVRKCGDERETVILVATSGDTGKAALDGFADVENTRIIVFYPSDGVSNIQKLQMVTQKGENVGVCAVAGNFDDAQTGVKRIFTDPDMAQRLNGAGKAFSSANSINWGRLVPQIVYYVSAYLDLLREEAIKPGDKINVVVPTGNFGNILAAYYARQMGIPINKLICASNANNVLTDFIRTGVYDRNRAFHTTISPSMDILISSNLERLLYHLSGCCSEKLSGWMKELSETGRYSVDDDVLNSVRELFWADFCDDECTKQQIKTTFEENSYLSDTHTAVALHVCDKYREQTGDSTPAVIASTASPYKFAPAVLSALEPVDSDADEFVLIERLSELTGWSVPEPLAKLRSNTVRFTGVCEKDAMADTVCVLLGI